MRKFTKLWQLMMIVLISSSVLLVQAQKNVTSEKAPVKNEQKLTDQKSESGFTDEQIVILQKQGIKVEGLLDKESQMKAEEILMMSGLLNPFGIDKGDDPSDAASGYTFSQTSSAYSPITGGTVVASSAPGTGLFLDDNSYSAQPIPFTFVFNGVPYTDFTVNTNGFISFGTTIPAGATYSPISGTTAYAGAIATFARDCDGRFTLQASTTIGSNVLTAVTFFGGVIVGEEITATNIPVGTTITAFDAGAGTITLSANATATGTAHACIVYSAEIRTETLGIAPNRIHVIQFKNFKRYGTTYYGELYNRQIRLYETTNRVQIVYGTHVGNTTSTTGQVGLRGATNADFNNRSTTTDWSATAAGALNSSSCTMSSTVYPASGLSFIWDPPLTPGDPYGPSPANLATTVSVATNLGWSFGANTNNYDLLFGTVNPPVTVVVSNGVATNPGSYDPPGNLSYSTAYYWQVVAKNGSGNTNGPVWSFTTSTNLPYAPITPSPANLASGVDVNADLSWTFGINTETYDLFFGTVTPPVTKVVDNAAAGATGTYDPGTMSYSTTYYWQVVARNSAKAETPGPIWRFSTVCDLYTLPISQGFNDATIPLCWQDQLVADPGTDPVLSYELTMTSPARNPYEGTRFVKFNSFSCTSGAERRLISPGFSTSGLSNVTVQFAWSEDPGYATYLLEGVTLQWSVDGINWNTPAGAFYQRVNTVDGWYNKTYTMPGDVLNLPTVYIGFLFHSLFGNNCALDDVSIIELLCPAPGGLTTTEQTQTSAKANWTDANATNIYDIVWGLVGFDPDVPGTYVGSELGKTFAASPYYHVMPSLTGSTNYEWYVRSDCGTKALSQWAGPAPFATLPGPHTLPLVEDFEAGDNFDYFDNALGNTVNWTINTAYYHGGAQCAYNLYGNTNTNILHETGILDLSSAPGVLLDFWHIAKTEGDWDHCYVEISTDGGATYSILPATAYQGSGIYDVPLYNTPAGPCFDEDAYALWGTGTEIPDNATWWQKETFSLDDYLTTNVRLRFRLHSDGSVLRHGWLLDDISVYVPVFGTLSGYVYKFGTTTPIANASIVIGSESGVSGVNGQYTIPNVIVGTYTVNCSASGYLGESAAGVVITDGGTTTQSFYLKWAEIVANPTLFNENLAPDTQLDKTLTLTNNAPAPLNYSTSIEFLTDGIVKSKAAGDILVDIDVQATNLDNGNLGAEFDGIYYYISGRNSAVAPYKLYKHDQTGALIATYDQPAQATSLWGLRDLAYNAGKIYGGSEDGFYEFDIATGVFTTLFTGNLGLTCIRALAYYPPSGNFLALNWSGAITEFNLAGTIIGTYTAPAALTGIYGMAWDSWNNKLWLFDQSGTPLTKFYEYDIATQALTGISYQVPMLTGLTDQIAGGAFFSTSLVGGKAVLGGLVQGTVNDHVFAMELNVTETWLSITANGSGIVPGTADGTIDITVHFDATGYPIGTVKTANIIIASNALNAPIVTIPVTMNVIVGYKVSGNVYYGSTGILKPMATNTMVTLTPHGTTSTGAGGYYEHMGVANGNYKLSGTTTKAWGGLQAFDATLIARYLGSIVPFTNLQKRAADLNLSNTITAFDGTLVKRRLGSIATPQWTAPNYVFDGPFPSSPVLDGLPVTVSGADVIQELRTLCAGDLNSSYTPPVE